MSVRKFSTASILSPSYKNSKFWDGNAFPGYFESIATVTLSNSTTGTITFDNIPQNYTHLQVRGVCRSTSASTGQDDLTLRYNNDQTNNYYWHRFGSSGSAGFVGSAGSLVSGSQIQECIARDGQTASVYTGMIIDILDYNSTNKYKTTRALTAADANGSGTTMFNSSLWQSTSAITRIDLSTASSWKIYTQFALYGIRSA